MTLAAGTKLGPYEIGALLGAGGMGEVYRARDTRLERTVAIKILHSHLSSNPDLKLRFDREARSVSALNHPHICVLHDVGSQDGVDFLVMEYVEGETLAQRLARGPLPLGQVLKIGSEIAVALDKAHRAGITHRDLKPANVMLTKSGAKLMDFGLAKGAGGIGGAQGPAPLLSAAETLASPSPLTTAGTIVGTIQYMSPEQIEGKEADARSDIFALGAVLHEMVTGKRAFDGKSQISVASAILEKDPEPISSILPSSPPALDLLIRTCLAKDPDARFQSAHDLMLQLQAIATGSAESRRPEPGKPRAREKSMWAAAALAAIMLAALCGYFLAPHGQNAGIMRVSIEAHEGFAIDFTGDYSGPPTLSPQGDKLVFSAHGPNSAKALWVRSFDNFSAHRLEGTDGAYAPFWSPEGKYIGFFANGKLNRVAAAGGPVTELADAPNARGGSWGVGDVIIMAPDIGGPIFQVGANGGKILQVTKLDVSKHTTHRWPWFLPDGKHFLYLGTNHNGGRVEDNGIYFASLDGKEERLVAPTDAGGAYASGYLLFHSGNALMAQSFDPTSGKLSGEALPVVSRIQHDSGVWRTLFSVSQNNNLVFESGTAEAAGTQLVWFDRSGKKLGQVAERAPYMDPRLSPDGKRLAVSFGDPQREIWMFGLDRGIKTRLTFSQAMSGAKIQPAWSPDGKTIAFMASVAASGGNNSVILSRPASGGAEKVMAGNGPEDSKPASTRGYRYPDWSPDGQFFTYIQGDGPMGAALYAKPLTANGDPFVVVAPASPQSNITYYRISPDGHWVAYTSNESGRQEVYIAPFPKGEGKWQASTTGARFAAWRGDSKELYFSLLGDQYAACTISAKGNELEIGTPKILFNANPTALGVDFDVTSDGNKFLVNVASDEAPAAVQLVMNWNDEFKKK